ncbi:LysR family transcriptional regulator [Phenylobacterium sp.]|uniref:LysR family transcriptional regulator n=1 Tax=Phenylobacterium sp. TaxID=1871053 RepID=UPI002732CCAB|nr:LysR family transcriptional regulator [Phenylobacterium sp.]MDP3661105.1 LysR family transcriptional regulator [Phenylobacterium sp.]
MRQMLAVQAHGSFARAAEFLGISQPSLSTAIARLEDQLGVRLFDRTPTGSELTPIGEIIAQRAVRVLAETESIIRDAELIAGGESGLFRLGVGAALKPNFLPRYVRLIAEQHPALSLHIDVHDRDKLLPLLKARELDLVVCAVGDEIMDEALVVTPIMAARVVAVSSPNHPLAAEGPISVARFAEFRAAGSMVGLYTNTEILGLRDDSARPSHYTASDYDPLVTLALSGACTLIAPLYVVQSLLDAGELVRLDLDWTFAVQFVAITTRPSSYSPIVAKLVLYAAEVGFALQDESGKTIP